MPKQDKEKQFEFNATVETVGDDGEPTTTKVVYTLPPYSESAGKVPGRVVQDLLMNPSSVTEMALQVHALNLSAASDEAKAALGELPASEMLEVLGRWMGESVRSSA